MFSMNRKLLIYRQFSAGVTEHVAAAILYDSDVLDGVIDIMCTCC